MQKKYTAKCEELLSLVVKLQVIFLFVFLFNFLQKTCTPFLVRNNN